MDHAYPEMNSLTDLRIGITVYSTNHPPWHRWSIHGPYLPAVIMMNCWCRSNDIPLVPGSLRWCQTTFLLSGHPPGTGGSVHPAYLTTLTDKN